jgi:hypothetical protein
MKSKFVLHKLVVMNHLGTIQRMTYMKLKVVLHKLASMNHLGTIQKNTYKT